MCKNIIKLSLIWNYIGLHSLWLLITIISKATTNLEPFRNTNYGLIHKFNDFQVEELIDIEFEPDNTELIVQAILVGAGFFLMFALGIFMCIRNQGYSDELQKA